MFGNGVQYIPAYSKHAIVGLELLRTYGAEGPSRVPLSAVPTSAFRIPYLHRDKIPPIKPQTQHGGMSNFIKQYLVFIFS